VCCQARLLFVVHADARVLWATLSWIGIEPSIIVIIIIIIIIIVVVVVVVEVRSRRNRSGAFVNVRQRRRQRGHYSKFGGSRHRSRRCQRSRSSRCVAAIISTTFPTTVEAEAEAAGTRTRTRFLEGVIVIPASRPMLEEARVLIS